jgi:hypothetical protein
MPQGQFGGVQHLPGGVLDQSCCEGPLNGSNIARPPIITVQGITNERMTQVREMHANLMGSPAGKTDSTELNEFEILLDYIMGFCRPATSGHHGHFLALAWMSANGFLDDTLRFGPPPPAQSLINAFHFTRTQLRLQRAVRRISQGNGQQTCGIPIEAVNDAGTKRIAPRAQLLAMMKQRIDQSAFVVTRRRVYDETRRFVHDQQFLIRVDEVQRDILRNGVWLTNRQGLQRDPISRIQPIALWTRAAVYQDQIGHQRVLDLVPGEIGTVLGQVAIQPLALGVGLHDEDALVIR